MRGRESFYRLTPVLLLTLFFMPHLAEAGDCSNLRLGDAADVYAHAMRRPETELSHIGDAVALNWSADSRYLGLATQYGTRLLLWDAQTKLISEAHREGALYSSSIAVLSTPPRLIFAADAAHDALTAAGPMSLSLSVWDMTSGRETRLKVKRDADQAFDASGMGDALAVARGLTVAKTDVTDIATGNLKFSVSLPEPVYSLRCFNDCRGWVAGGLTGELFLYSPGQSAVTALSSPFHLDISTGGEVDGTVYALAATPDGRVAAAGVGIVTKGLRRGTGRVLDKRYDDKAAENAIRLMPAVTVIVRQDGHVEGQQFGQCGFIDIKESPIRSLSWDLRRNVLAAVTSSNKLLLLTSYMGKPVIRQIASGSYLSLASVSPNGNFLAVAVRDNIRIFELGQ